MQSILKRKYSDFLRCQICIWSMLCLSSSIYFWNENRFVKEKEKWKQIHPRPNPNHQGSVAVCLTNADTAVLATGRGDTVSTARFYVEGKAPEHWHPQLELKGEWGGGRSDKGLRKCVRPFPVRGNILSRSGEEVCKTQVVNRSLHAWKGINLEDSGSPLQPPAL